MNKNKLIKRGCGCLLIAILFVVVAMAIIVYLLKPKWHDEYGRDFRDIAYADRPHNTYDLFLPHTTSDSIALILYVHGGSWLGGDKKEHHGDCYKWVQQGYATATMNYSLLNEDSTSIPTMLNEIGRCICHIKQFAEKEGVHLSQMAIAGTSAGGHLAMLFAYSQPQPMPIRFLATKVGPADFRILFPNDSNATQDDVQRFVYSCTGQHIIIPNNTSNAWLDSIKLQTSPVGHINESTALPALWAYGEEDGLIKPAHYHALQSLYDSLSAPYDLIVFPNSGHTLMGDADCRERYESTLSTYCKKYFGY